MCFGAEVRYLGLSYLFPCQNFLHLLKKFSIHRGVQFLQELTELDARLLALKKWFVQNEAFAKLHVVCDHDVLGPVRVQTTTKFSTSVKLPDKHLSVENPEFHIHLNIPRWGGRCASVPSIRNKMDLRTVPVGWFRSGRGRLEQVVFRFLGEQASARGRRTRRLPAPGAAAAARRRYEARGFGVT